MSKSSIISSSSNSSASSRPASSSSHFDFLPQKPSTLINDHRIICYSISTSENSLGHLRWEVKDSENRLVFKSVKELTPTEIVESIQDPTGETLWTIRRPTRGWYLVIRSPKHSDPQKFIGLQPAKILKHKKEAMEFSFRLSRSSSSSTKTAIEESSSKDQKKRESNESVIKKRKPSIPSSPQSPKHSKSPATSSDSEFSSHHQTPLQTEETLIRLKPIEEDPKEKTVLKSFTSLFINTNKRFKCFLDPSDHKMMMTNETELRPEPYTPTTESRSSSLLEYEDRNSIFGIANHGILTIDLHNSLQFSLLDHLEPPHRPHFHQAFWVAICIAYLGFRADQEAYAAATDDQ